MVKNKLSLQKKSPNEYQIKYNDILIGSAIRDVDGYFYFWDNKDLTGFTTAWALRGIADLLDALNKPLDDHLNDYFSSAASCDGSL